MNWPTRKIGDITHVVTKGTTPTKEEGFSDNGINFIKAEALNGDGALNPKGFFHITEEVNEKLKRSILQEDDVLLTIAGAYIGKCGIVKPSHLPANTNQAVGIIRVDKSKADPLFIYYWFKQKRTFLYIQGLNAQAAQPNINLAMLKNIEVPLSGMSEQRAVAETIRAYDDLIENNRRRIQLLEQAARLLYKEWFVHLRFPGHEHVKIKNSIPKGWEKGAISDFYDTTSGGTPSRKHPEFYEGDINWVKTQELNEDYIFETDEKITSDALRKSSAKLFPENTLLVSIYGGTNIGRTGVLASPSASNQACVALFPRHKSANHIYAQLFFQDIRENLIGIAQGVAQTNISQQTLRKVIMVMPAESLMQGFLSSVTPIYDQLKTLKQQNEMLANARDLLLPRLMNGEIVV